MPAKLAERTASDLFNQRCDGEPQLGDRLRVGEAVLVVRELNDDGVTRVGLKFGGVGQVLFGQSATPPQPRRGWPWRR